MPRPGRCRAGTETIPNQGPMILDINDLWHVSFPFAGAVDALVVSSSLRSRLIPCSVYVFLVQAELQDKTIAVAPIEISLEISREIYACSNHFKLVFNV